MCTLHSFPHNIDHCLTFARSEFEGLLEKAPAEANAFLLSPEQYLNGIQQVGPGFASKVLHGAPCLKVHCFRRCWPDGKIGTKSGQQTTSVA